MSPSLYTKGWVKSVSATRVKLQSAVTTAVLSLAVSAISAAAARQSASAANVAAGQARATEMRGLVRDIVVACQGVLSETYRLDAVASRLKNGYQSLFALAGRSRGGDDIGLIERVESKRKELPDLRGEALRLIENPHSLSGASPEDLALSLAKFHGHLVRLGSLRQEFEAEVAFVEEQVRPLRGRALDR